MKEVITTIILFGVVAALIYAVVVPTSSEVKDTGSKAFNSIKSMNENIQ